MEVLDFKKVSKKEQSAAMESYDALAATIERLHSEILTIEIEETEEKIKIPLSALKLLASILKDIAQGTPVSIVPITTELTTQAAAEFLGCSRPHVVKLLEQGKINFTKVGKHRRIKYEDLVRYKKEMKQNQNKLITEMMAFDEKHGLYES